MSRHNHEKNIDKKGLQRKDTHAGMSPYDFEETKPINAGERKKSNELTHEELVKALGKNLVSELTSEQIAALNADDEKRERIRNGDMGRVFDANTKQRNELRDALFPETVQPPQGKPQPLQKQVSENEGRHNRNNRPNPGKSTLAAIAATAALGSGIAVGYWATAQDHENGSSRSYDLANSSLTPDQASEYFSEGKNTSEMPGKHDLNDFGPPSQPGFNTEVGGDMTGLMNEWQAMFQGNAHITASYLKVFGVGTKQMPSLQELSDPAKFLQFDTELNKLGDDMRNNPSLRADLQNRLMKVLNSAHVIEKGQYTTDQISFYSDERNKPDGVKEARVSLDRRVADRGDDAKYLKLEVTLENGQKFQFEIKPGCHLQITWVTPSPEYRLGTPTQPVEVATPPPESVPPSWNQPPEQPPEQPQPPQQPPEAPQQPQPPQTPTPKTDNFNLPGRDNGTNAGEGSYIPAPQHTEPVSPPKHIPQIIKLPPLRPGSNMPPESSSSLPGSRSGINTTHTPGSSGVAPHGPVISVPKPSHPHTADRGGPR